jgi:hypothetical protein
MIGQLNSAISRVNDFGNSIESASGGTVNIPDIPQIPRLAVGTPLVKRSGLAVIHEGEAVVTKAENPNNPENKDKMIGGQIVMNFHFDGVSSKRQVRQFFEESVDEMLYALKKKGLTV